jgi:hypothetical protein
MKIPSTTFNLESELKNLDQWVDPNPDPVIEVVDGFNVVRDDLLEAGSKMRFCDYLIKNSTQTEFVYGSAPRWGYGPVSAAFVCQKYGKKFTLFLAESKAKHPNYFKMLDYGATIHEVPMGFLAVTEKRARDYTKADTNRVLLPIGLCHPSVLASIVKVARQLPIVPKRFFTAAGSGTLNRGLQLAWPKAEANMLSVGHKLTPEEQGRGIVHVCELKFPQHAKKADSPPFGSVPEYDAKVWKLIKQIGRPGDLFWNVAA